MKVFKFLLAVLIVSGLWSLSAKASQSNRILCPQRPIKLAMYNLGLLLNKGQGLDADFVEELKKRSPCDFEVKVVPRARIWKEIETGGFDMTTSGIETAERAKFAYFHPYLRQKNYAVLSLKLTPNIASPEDFLLKDQKLQWGVVRSFKHGKEADDFLEKLRLQLRVIEATDSDQLLKMLQGDRIAGIFALPIVFRHKLVEYNLENKVKVLDWDKKENGIEHGLVLSKKSFSPEQAKAWGELINKMHRDGTIEKLLLKYLPESEAKAALIKL